MIRVLRDWREVGEAVVALQREGLPLHDAPQKNFDHFMLREVLAGLDKEIPIVDLGCGHAYTLAFLHALRFSRLVGVDLTIDGWARARRVRLMLRERSWRAPYRLIRGDLARTPLLSGSQDVVLSISTIEHGVEVEAFLAEAARLLRPGGLLFLTTDYWEDKISTTGSEAFGMPWQIFSREQIVALVDSASRLGLKPVANGNVPPCLDKTVFWQGHDYTFVAILFKKCESQQ